MCNVTLNYLLCNFLKDFTVELMTVVKIFIFKILENHVSAKPDFLVRRMTAVAVCVTLFKVCVITSESVAIW